MMAAKILVIFALGSANAFFIDKKIHLINQLKHKLGLGGGLNANVGLDYEPPDWAGLGLGGWDGCHTEYQTEWFNEYQELEEPDCEGDVQDCREEIREVCTPTTSWKCQTIQKRQCTPTTRRVCTEVIRTENVKSAGCSGDAQGLDVSTGCQYKWEGKGENMRWAVIPGTCNFENEAECFFTPTPVNSQECEDVPDETCSLVPTEECGEVEDQVCVDKTEQICDQVQLQLDCPIVHKKKPVRVSKRVPVRICNGNGGGGGGGLNLGVNIGDQGGNGGGANFVGGGGNLGGSFGGGANLGGNNGGGANLGGGFGGGANLGGNNGAGGNLGGNLGAGGNLGGNLGLNFGLNAGLNFGVNKKFNANAGAGVGAGAGFGSRGRAGAGAGVRGRAGAPVVRNTAFDRDPNEGIEYFEIDERRLYN